MMREKIKSGNKRIFAFTAAIVTAIIALVITALSFAFTAAEQPTVYAETGGSVTFHVFDTKEEYSKLGGWIWIKSVDMSKAEKMGDVLADEQFVKGNNKAHSITISLTENAVTKLKTGSSLGFLILKLKDSPNFGSNEFNDWFVKDGEQDVTVDLSQAFDENNHADIYFVRKDTTAYTNIEDAIMALEKITSARFTSKTANGVTVAFTTTSAMSNGMAVSIVKGSETIATSTVTISDPYTGTATFAQLNASNFEFTEDYKLKVEIIPNPATIAKTALIDDAGFIALYESRETQELEYGAIYTPQKTTFRLWAPFAASVNVKLYARGTGGEAEVKRANKRMTDGVWGGAWELDVSGDLNGKYYTFEVDNYGNVVEAMDPYARAAGADGLRAMVVDLDATDPDGWDSDSYLYNLNPQNADVPIVWELVIKDFSSAANSGMVNKGKYLAFTEKGTTVPGDPTLKTGVDYLKDLGITYVHLNPTYDFASVPEGDMSDVNAVDSFNWGYDPQNYNVPEGSYSSDPTRGEVRINEFKQMVMALHEAGIGVIMDVVYNHTFNTSGQAFHDTVPSYYHRTNADGVFTDASGCGNEVASERSMVRKYMVESLVYWAEEYHIDGFRFDLMGIHDIDTMKAIRSALDGVDGGKGKKILMYGEPWAADGDYVPASFTKRINASKADIPGAGKYAKNSSNNQMIKSCFAGGNYKRDMTPLPDRVAVFNDTGREGLRGNNDPGQGWANGNLGGISGIKKMMEGGCGTSGTGMTTRNGSQNVAYASAHDNYTLWDQMMGKQGGKETPLFYDEPIDYNVKQCEIASSAYMMSSGIAFMIAGEEIGRTKYGNHNSYNSPMSLNAFDWRRQKDFKALYDHYKRTIAVRKAYASLFSYEGTVNKSNCTGNFTGTSDETGLIVFTRNVGGKKLVCILNASDSPATVSGMGGMKVYLENGVVKNNTASSASMKVNAKSTIILGSESI